MARLQWLNSNPVQNHFREPGGCRYSHMRIFDSICVKSSFAG